MDRLDQVTKLVRSYSHTYFISHVIISDAPEKI